MESEIVKTLKSILENIQSSTFSNILSILSVGLSGIAILVAIIVPRQIAKHQNKIAVFEKRYAVYETLDHCISFAQSLKKGKLDIEEIRQLFIVCFSCQANVADPSPKAVHIECTKYAVNTRNILYSAKFIFCCNIEVYVQPIIETMFKLIYKTEESEKEEVSRKYIAEVQKMERELLPQIERELSVNKMSK